MSTATKLRDIRENKFKEQIPLFSMSAEKTREWKGSRVLKSIPLKRFNQFSWLPVPSQFPCY